MSSVSRVLGIDINTVSKLLIDAGNACKEFHDRVVRNVPAKYVQCDEIWSFCYAKEANAAYTTGAIDAVGDVWTWVAIERYSKLIISWLAGSRGSDYALEFMDDLRSRLASRIQLTTDGYRAYPEAVEGAFGGYVDYAQAIKVYEQDAGGHWQHIGNRKVAIVGTPNLNETSTSHVERHNLTMRMSMRRFTRSTNAFSKKLENHRHALALYYVWYNFCRKHGTLSTTPAVSAGLADRSYDIRWIVDLIDERVPIQKRGPYRKRAA